MRARSMEFPRRLKELKELDNDTTFSLIGNDTNHLSDRRGVKGPARQANLRSRTRSLLLLLFPLLLLIRLSVLKHDHKNE